MLLTKIKHISKTDEQAAEILRVFIAFAEDPR